MDTAGRVTADELRWDPYDYDLHRDPHPVWRRMMDDAPLYRNEQFDFWAMTRFDDVLNGLVDWRTFSSAQGDQLEIIRGGPIPESQNSIISNDAPYHTSLRRLLSRAFTPRSVSDLESVTRRFAQELLDEHSGSTSFDYVEDFGSRLPGMVIATMLGIPDGDREYIRRTTDEQLHREPGERDMQRHHRVAAELVSYYSEQLADRRTKPRDDMMSALLAAEITEDDGSSRKLTDAEAVAFIKLLSSAGNETTAKLIGWIGSSLAKFPGERVKLVKHPELIPNAVEEILRYEPPALCLARVVRRDVVLHGEVVPEGGVMVFIQAATGRDPRQFPDPDRLHVERKIERHLSFGFGPHVCLGAPLARLEARIALEETLLRFSEWDVDWEGCEVVHTGSAVRGYSKLPIRVVKRGPGG
jgi:cytochrome P450